jgi:hypothetical protein
MPFLRLLLVIAIFYSSPFSGSAQPPGWTSLTYNKATLNYPNSWHVVRESRGQHTRVTMTPDSMQQLAMRMVTMYDVPTDEKHNFAFFKKNFSSILQPSIGSDGKILKTEDITFKGHDAIYAEVTADSLPIKVYYIDAGTDMYMVLVTQRRYSEVADPGLERDGMGILNSINFLK